MPGWLGSGIGPHHKVVEIKTFTYLAKIPKRYLPPG